jgi:hypothetical protein
MAKTSQMVATIGMSTITHEIRGEFRYDRSDNRTMCGYVGSLGVASWQSGKELDVTCKRCVEAGPKWIVYTHVDVPGRDVTGLMHVESLKEAVATVAEWSRGMCEDAVSARLYPFTDDAWEDAQEFKSAGCPFDYPSYVIERGPRGGLRVVEA